MSKLAKLLTTGIVIIFLIASLGIAMWVNIRREVRNGVNANIEVLNENFEEAQNVAVAVKDDWEQEQSVKEPNLLSSAEVFKLRVQDIITFRETTESQRQQLEFTDRESVKEIATEFDDILNNRQQSFATVQELIEGRVCQLEKLNTLIESFKSLSDQLGQIDGQAPAAETTQKLEEINTSLNKLKTDHTDYYNCHQVFEQFKESIDSVYEEDQNNIQAVADLYNELSAALNEGNIEQTEEINNKIKEKGNLTLKLQLDESYNQITILVSSQLSEILDELNKQSQQSEDILRPVKATFLLS